MKKYKIGYTTGVFDMFHIGHLNILRRAKEQCEYLIVGVSTDELCLNRKNKKPIIFQEDRVEIISAIKYVDEVVLQSDMNKIEAIKKHKVNAVFVGSDWKNSDAWLAYEKEFSEFGCEVVYLDHTEGISSTIIREKLNDISNA